MVLTSDGQYEYGGWIGQAGAICHYEHTIWDDQNVGAGMAGAATYTRYVNVADYAMPIGMAVVTN